MATAHFVRPEDTITHARRHDVDAGRLGRELERVIRGEVRFDAGSRALYATDGSNYRQPPIGVVIPRDSEDVVAAVEVCRAHHAPIFARGCGTSLGGQCCNAAVCFDMSKYLNQVLEIDPARRLARVQPGTILDELRAAAGAHGLTFGPDPATHSHCTLGGMIGNNSCGVHSVMAQFYGPGARTSDNVEALEILTYDGVRMWVDAELGSTPGRWRSLPPRGRDILTRLQTLTGRYADEIRGMPHIPRRVSGFNLTALLPEHGFNVPHALVGSEGTCVTVLQAVLRLIPNPSARTLVVLGYPSVYEAADHVEVVMAHRPIGCEGLDHRLVRDIEALGKVQDVRQTLPRGSGYLLVEFGGEDKAESDARARAFMKDLAAHPSAPSMRLFDNEEEEAKVWKVRESGLGATAHVDKNNPTWPGWEDSAVPPARLGEYLRKLEALLNRHGLHGDLYGHFGQGCVHTRIDFNLRTAEGIRTFRSFVEEAADLVVSLGGSLSGEHGDGQARGELLSRMYSPALMNAFREFKRIWDPGWKMNPGKVIDAYPLDQNLRLGTHYNPPPLDTHFQFPNESGGFAKATMRCVGVGECRRLEHGTMCPSFKATREEKHSTRGRARLLFEMLQGDPLTDLWQSEPVKEALDLCLACKGCKGDCPVSVDMATYKAEFLSHYFEGHRRPISAYAFGLIHYWARLASYMPRTVNLFTQTPGLRAIAKLASGMAQERQIPPFAPYTFTDWFATQPPQLPADRPRVILWPDTFNNHFHPETAIAAVRVLQRAGYRVDVPRQPLCCGRPLFDYGMLDRAKDWLSQVIQTLGPDIEAGVPVVGLEPSCVSVLRDELTQLFPDSQNAGRLAQQTYLLSELLHKDQVTLPRLHRRAIVHGHCHHQAVLKMGDEEAVLKGAGLECTMLDAGCCGLAGSFGFERDHYDVSMKVGELSLLPAVRQASRDTLVISNGFSCRTQIKEATGRRALHLAEVLDMAATQGPQGPSGDYPERDYANDYSAEVAIDPARLAMAAGAIVVGVAAYLLVSRRRPPVDATAPA